MKNINLNIPSELAEKVLLKMNSDKPLKSIKSRTAAIKEILYDYATSNIAYTQEV